MLAAAGCPNPLLTVDCDGTELWDGGACVPGACGLGRWGTLHLDESTVFVNAAAPAGGDGSKAAPFQGIQAGADLAGLNGGGLVAVAAGTYLENVLLSDEHKDVSIAGRCQDLVAVDGSAANQPVFEVNGGSGRPRVSISSLSITRSSTHAVYLSNARVTLEDVVITGTTGDALLVGASTSADLARVSIHDLSPGEDGVARGLDVENGAVVTAVDCDIADASQSAVFVDGASTSLTLSNSRIRDARASDDFHTTGLWVANGAHLASAGVSVSGTFDWGLYASGAGTTVSLSDSTFSDIVAAEEGYGLVATEGAQLSVTRSDIARVSSSGVAARDAGTVVEMTACTISDVLPSVSAGGAGVEVGDGAAFSADDLVIERSSDIGVYLHDGATGTLSNTRVSDVSTKDGIAFGIVIENGAVANITSSTVDAISGVGIGIHFAGAALALSDSVVVDTSAGDVHHGNGIQVYGGGKLTAERVSVLGTVGVGLNVEGSGSTVTLTDSEVSGTLSSAEGDAGNGVQVHDGATLTGSGVSLVDNHSVGLIAGDPGASVHLTDSFILDTVRGRESGCAMGLATQDDGEVFGERLTIAGTQGPGLYTYGGTLRCEACQITDNTFAGALVVKGSTLDLTDSTVADTLPDAEYGGGFGVYATSLYGSPTITISGSSIGPHLYAGVWLDGPGAYDIRDNVIAGSTGTPIAASTMHGNAVFAESGTTPWDGATGLLLSGNTFSDASAIAVLLHAASATLDGNSWSGNGSDLRQQSCADVSPLGAADLAGIPVTDVCPDTNVIIAYGLGFETLRLPSVSTDN